MKMKQNVSPQIIVAIAAAIVLMLGLVTWKVFFSSGNSALTQDEMKTLSERKDRKEEKGESH